MGTLSQRPQEGLVVQWVECWLSTNKSPEFDSLVLPKLGQWHIGLSFLPLQRQRQDQEHRVIPGLRQLLPLPDYKTRPQQRRTKALEMLRLAAASLQWLDSIIPHDTSAPSVLLVVTFAFLVLSRILITRAV